MRSPARLLLRCTCKVRNTLRTPAALALLARAGLEGSRHPPQQLQKEETTATRLYQSFKFQRLCLQLPLRPLLLPGGIKFHRLCLQLPLRPLPLAGGISYLSLPAVRNASCATGMGQTRLTSSGLTSRSVICHVQMSKTHNPMDETLYERVTFAIGMFLPMQ